MKPTDEQIGTAFAEAQLRYWEVTEPNTPTPTATAGFRAGWEAALAFFEDLREARIKAWAEQYADKPPKGQLGQ